MGDSSDDQDKLEYLKKDLLLPSSAAAKSTFQWKPVVHTREEKERNNDDDSNHMFMSEPSMSEADSSEHYLRLLSPTDSFTEEDNNNITEEENNLLLLPPPPPPATSRLASQQYPQQPYGGATSPGNTSLSSWESPHFSRRVQLHFSPDPDERKDNNRPPSSTSSPYRIDTSNVGKKLHLPAATNSSNRENPMDGMQTQPRYRSSSAAGISGDGASNADRGGDQRSANSTSSASEGQRRRLDDFLHDLRVTSRGRVHESAAIDANASFESPFKPPQDQAPLNMNGVLRPTHASTSVHPVRTSSVDTAPVQNISPSSIPLSSIATQSRTSHTQTAADDTVVMTLSASEDEDKDDTTTTEDVHRPLDWENQHSADDEKTADRPRRIRGKPPTSHRRQRSGDSKVGHRRQRSGDAAAASLVTGSLDWKGMEQDKIPLPPVPGDHDDEEDDDVHEKQRNGKMSSDHTNPLHKVLSQIEGGFMQYDRSNSKSTVMGEAMDPRQFSQFAIGTAGNVPSTNNNNNNNANRQMRRPRRDGRSGRPRRHASFEQSMQDIPTPQSPISEFPIHSMAGVRASMNTHSPLRPENRPSIPMSRLAYYNNSSGIAAGSSPASDLRAHHRSSSAVSGGEYPGNDRIRVPSSPDSVATGLRNAMQSGSFHLTGDYNVPSSFKANHGADFATGFEGQWGQDGRGAYISTSFTPPSNHSFMASNSSMDRSDTDYDERLSSSYGTSPMSTYPWFTGRGFNAANDGNFRRTVDTERAPTWRRDRMNYHPTPEDETESQDDSGESESESTGSETSLEKGINFHRLDPGHRHDPGMSHPETVVRHHHSPFANIGKSSEKADRRKFLPYTSFIDTNEQKYPTYICPRCKTRQREFFTVSDAPRQFEGASGFVALCFGLYVIAALYIFGLQEGWPALDCIYFAVITLTTAGLGDLVPTSDSAKISCSLFIYFGVACIGLLLGSYIAGMLDETSKREAKENRIESCPNCARLRNIKDEVERKQRMGIFQSVRPLSPQGRRGSIFMSERSGTHVDSIMEHRAKKSKVQHHSHKHSSDMHISHHFAGPESSQMPLHGQQGFNVELSPSITRSYQFEGNRPQALNHQFGSGFPPNSPMSPHNIHQQNNLLGSPLTAQILGRQSHTRHASLDLGSGKMVSKFGANGPTRARKFSADLPTTVEETGDFPDGETALPPPPPPIPKVHAETVIDDDGDSMSFDSDEYTDSDSERPRNISRVKNVKYVIITLKEALVNSMVIIAFGCLGFFFIEGFSIVDSWYFTTVLLTTVGYGDIVPVTKGGKLFATVYILVAGTILLNNMSLISMIPLELRKRRIEQAVLTQFGDQLDDAALRELATGPLIQRLRLAERRDGLDECTREMFALAMLVRLGKVTEKDIRSTFAAFRRLDVNDDGVLNSKSIIAAMIQKRRSCLTMKPMQAVPQPSRDAYSTINSYAQYWSGWNSSQNASHAPNFNYSQNQPYRENGALTPDERSSLLSGVSAYNSFR